MKTLLAWFLLFLISNQWIAIASEPPGIDEILANSFPGVSKDQLEIKPLKGGLSATSLYKIDSLGKQYVLRIHQSKHWNEQDKREHFAIIEAAKKGIAPSILYVSPDHRALLMDFVDCKTLSIEQAKLPNNCTKIALAIRQAHQIEGHPHQWEDLLSKANRCYAKVSKDRLGSQEEIEGAFELVKKYRQELSQYDYSKVNVHGDLNPRNIFLTPQGVLFIDWAETSFDDPFYDLSYFAQKLDYNEEEERLFLEAYLQRSPTAQEMNRYQLQKKIHQAFWSLTNLYLADVELKKHPQQLVEKNASLKKWSTYQKAYEDCSEELSAQYFYELSRLNYQLASENH